MRWCSMIIIFFAALSLVGCSKKDSRKRTVLAIPVYGQSLALGEEAVRITDFDSLSKISNHLVVTENLDEEFGYFSDSQLKQWLKNVIGDRHRSFELSIYGMSEVVTQYLNTEGYSDSVIICTFPGGRGATGIRDLSKGSKPYKKFLEEIKTAYKKAQTKGWDFVVPAFCWMQGENDIMWKSNIDYKEELKNFQINFNHDVKAITKQNRDVMCISYQTNCISLSKEFDEELFNLKEASIPQGQLDLILDDSLFMASGPTYPYSFVGERVHLDGLSQKRLGYLAGLSVIRLLESKPSKGLIPLTFRVSQNAIFIEYNVPNPPLVLDTVAVVKADNYGFSVIDSNNSNILERVILNNNTIELRCKQKPLGTKVRYAINGSKGKSGNQHGPRGNLRDSQGKTMSAKILGKDYPLHNWSYQFDVIMR